MEANKILQADFLDLLFEDRNKEYGAYELRKKYNKRITLALLITAGIVAGAIGATLLANDEIRNVYMGIEAKPAIAPA